MIKYQGTEDKSKKNTINIIRLSQNSIYLGTKIQQYPQESNGVKGKNLVSWIILINETS